MRRRLGVLALVLAACAGDQGPRARPRPPLFETQPATGAADGPAAWRYHPQAAAAMNVRVALGAGATLYAGQRGERWLSDEGSRSVSAAARLAPEELIGAQRLGQDGWLFLGASGTTYQARTPLGAFVKSSAPLTKLVRVSASGSGLLGVKRDGTLAHSADGGASWRVVGPAERLFADAVLSADGRGLALAVPEELWLTRDHGQTWRAAGTSPVGGLSLGLGTGDSLVINGPLGPHRFVGDGTPRLERLDQILPRQHFTLPVSPDRGPDAGPLTRGRALWLGDRYVELGSVGAPRRLTLLEGTIPGPLRSIVVPALEGCQDARIAAFESQVYLACLSGPDSDRQRVTFFRRRGEGWVFEREALTAVANPVSFRMAAGRDALLVTGICPTHDGDRGCVPRGVHYLRPRRTRAEEPDAGGAAAAAKSELVPAALPALAFTAAALAFSADGRTAYALGRRTKAGEYALFVSRDGGQTFAPRVLDDLPSDYATGRSGPSPDPVEAELAPADDGSLAVVLSVNNRSLLLVTNAEGRVVSMSNPPGDGAQVGAYGSRALAVSVSARQVWETLDGGASWQSVGRLPVSPCPGDVSCDVPIACAQTGCVVGQELTRRGWNGQGDDDAGVLLPPDVPRVGFAVGRKLRTPVSCTLEPAPWRDLEGALSAPTADQAAIGKAQWFAVTMDHTRASAGIIHAYGGARPRVEAVALLPPAARPERFALHVSTQVEGAAALRYPIPESRPGETHLRDVEVGWSNLFEGRVVRARVADGGVYRPGDYERTGGVSQRARPNLLSITSGGLYLRVHAGTGSDQTTWFLDGSASREVRMPDWPKAVIEQSHREITRVNGAHVPVAFFGKGAAVLRARPSGNGWAFDGIATGFERPKAFDLHQHHDLAYVGSTPGLHVLLFTADSPWRRGYLFPFRADGAPTDPPIPVPAQLDTSDPPRACGESSARTPRVIEPFQMGTRHAVIVSDASEPLRVLATSSAVMRGTPAEPCVAAFDAEAVKTDASAEPVSESAILPLGDLEHAWLFRKSRAADGQWGPIQYRNMSCRFDARAEVPPELYRLPGVTVTIDDEE